MSQGEVESPNAMYSRQGMLYTVSQGEEELINIKYSRKEMSYAMFQGQNDIPKTTVFMERN